MRRHVIAFSVFGFERGAAEIVCAFATRAPNPPYDSRQECFIRDRLCKTSTAPLLITCAPIVRSPRPVIKTIDAELRASISRR